MSLAQGISIYIRWNFSLIPLVNFARWGWCLYMRRRERWRDAACRFCAVKYHKEIQTHREPTQHPTTCCLNNVLIATNISPTITHTHTYNLHEGCKRGGGRSSNVFVRKCIDYLSEITRLLRRQRRSIHHAYVFAFYVDWSKMMVWSGKSVWRQVNVSAKTWSRPMRIEGCLWGVFIVW